MKNIKIEMMHGGGGAETNELIRAVFAKHFSNEYLEPMGDAAVVPVASGKIAMTTDAFVVRPLVFPGGDIGRLSVCGTVNDLLMSGAEPRYLTASFAIEEGMEVDLLDRIAASMRETCDEAGVEIVAGDTKVIEGAGGLIVTTAGVGEILGEPVSISGALPGDAVIVSGNLGDHHACILSARMGIENGILSDNAPLAESVRALRAAGIPVHAMRDVTRGGLATILNEIAVASRCRIELNERLLPVSREVRGLCAILGLDPLYMGNEGKFLAVVPEDRAEEALGIVRASRYGKDAARIGNVREGKGVSLQTDLGGRRTIPVLRGEGLPRIC
jgi:hydrogenase expression/formation protein HypE